MRPLRLDLDGFAVFREPIVVDFTDADFFALVGPTGSGKSTILDAICFALYGTVPRWGDRRAIANALSPSAREARVRLVFESAGARYVVTRVVHRNNRNSVSTKHAGLEALPPGYDLTWFDNPELRPAQAQHLGQSMSGSPGAIDKMVEELIGLPYEQFTKCVVLPQGEFAAFLHAKPAERQKILVNLLGLEVYGKIREQASKVAAAAEAKASVAANLLLGLTEADDEAVSRAQERVAVVELLGKQLTDLLPAREQAQSERDLASQKLATVTGELAILTRVTQPPETERVTAAARHAAERIDAAIAAVTAAETEEERLRARITSSTDPGMLRGQLEAHAELARLAARSEQFQAQIRQLEAQHNAAARNTEQARQQAAAAGNRLEAAREAYMLALAGDKAASLRQQLKLGHPCPVCEHPVDRLPRQAHRHPGTEAAHTAGNAAREQADRATAEVTRLDQEARELQMRLAGLVAQAEQLSQQQRHLTQRLETSAGPETLREELAAADALARQAELAAQTVRRLRAAHRTTLGDADQAQKQLRTAWQRFDQVRDQVITFGPPPADRDDLTLAWETLTGWAATAIRIRNQSRADAEAEVAAASRQMALVATQIAELFTQAELTPPQSSADPVTAVAVAVARAQAAVQNAIQRREDAQRLRDERADQEHQALVARSLAGHLRSNNFEQWLLDEALDGLVAGASTILRELSADQYDLAHEKGEFQVIDHHDAGMKRAVRTLSGGETFQASLALALALAEQMSGLSSTASLESILLDEGFGTLDASTMETVATTLENLAARGDRMVGVVTHVGALADRIPVRFEVSRDARTARVERTTR